MSDKDECNDVVIVGGYHNGSRLRVLGKRPIELIEHSEPQHFGGIEHDQVRAGHTYLPQTINIAFGREPILVYVPVGQDLYETISILVGEH